MGHALQEEVLTYEGNKILLIFNIVQEEEECVSNEHMGNASSFQDAEEDHEEEKAHIQCSCPFDEDFLKDIGTEVVDKV